MMPNKVLLSLATVALFTATASAVATDYTAETRTNWVNVAVKNASDLTAFDRSAEGFGSATLVGESGSKYIDLDTASSAPMKYTPTSNTATAFSGLNVVSYRFDAEIKSLVVNASVPTVSGTPIASLTAVTNTSATATPYSNWYGLGKSGFVKLYGVEPRDGGSYSVTIELGTNTVSEATHKYARYLVNNVALTQTSGGSDSYVDLGVGTSFTFTSLGFAGCGQFQNFSGNGIFTTQTITLDTATEEQVTALASMLGISTGEVSGNASAVVAALNEVGGNELPKWQSVVLGLPSTDAKPYTAPVQTNDGTLGFTIGNASVHKFDDGKKVTFGVYECNANGEVTVAEPKETSEVTGAESSVVTITPDDTGVKYYKIKITIE